MAADPSWIFAKLSIPVGVLTTVIGGSAWLTTTRNRVEQVANDLVELKAEYRSQKDKILDRLEMQDDKLSEANARLSGLDAKVDIIINAVKRKQQQ